MEVSIVGRSNFFHCFHQWKIPRIYAVEASMGLQIPLHLLPRASQSSSCFKTFIRVHRRPFHQRPWTMVDVDLLPWKVVKALMELDGSFRCRWKWKIPLLPSIVASTNKYSVEASMSFLIPLHTATYFHEYRKLPDASTRLSQGSIGFCSIYFHGN